MHRRHGPTLAEKRRRIPKLPGTADRGAPLPAPQPGVEFVNTAGRFEDPIIVQRPKQPYSERR